MKQMKLHQNKHRQDPKYVHHPIQDISVFMTDTFHIYVNQFHLKFDKEFILSDLWVRLRHLLIRLVLGINLLYESFIPYVDDGSHIFFGKIIHFLALVIKIKKI